MDVRLLVRGDRACFRRPEFAEDMVSYDVITPLAARCVLEAVHAGAPFGWQIDEIRVLQPLRMTWMALAEVERGAAVAGIVGGRRDRRMAQVLTDVAYVVTARAEVADPPALFHEKVVRGRFVRPPCLGHRSFPAEIALLDEDAPLPEGALAGSGAVDLGWMLHDYHEQSRARFFRPTMIDGVIDLRQPNSLILAG